VLLIDKLKHGVIIKQCFEWGFGVVFCINAYPNKKSINGWQPKHHRTKSGLVGVHQSLSEQKVGSWQIAIASPNEKSGRGSLPFVPQTEK
jgi:hypothetical protein